MFDKTKDSEKETSIPANPFRAAKGSAKVVIGNGVKIKGELNDADEVQIDGHADITIETKNLFVGGTGTLKGNIVTDNLDVWGKVEGEVKVNGTLTVQDAGEISGNIEYQELQIKLGGRIKGDVKSLDKIKKLSEATEASVTPLQETAVKK